MLAVRAGLALALANIRYWLAVAPLVRRQLTRWRGQAQAIEDPAMRTLALEKLRDEGFNAEVAATLATLAPRVHRGRVVEAIVALEVLYDFLDGVTEPLSSEDPDECRLLFAAFTDAVTPARRPTYHRNRSRCASGCYLDELARTVREALAQLPAASVLAEPLRTSAARAAAAQLHIHAALRSDDRRLTSWAIVHSVGTPLAWREFLAGAASSVLAVHALIAAAAKTDTTLEQGRELDRIYLSIAVLPTVLDSLVDYEQDECTGFVRLYNHPAGVSERLASVIRIAVHEAHTAPNGAYHVMTLVGVVAYYASAGGQVARPVTDEIAQQLRPLMSPTLAVMRAWRALKRARPLSAAKPATMIGAGV